MRRWLLLGVIGLGLVAALASAHDARAAGEVRTRVEIRPIGPLVIGEPADLLVDLRVAGGGALADQPVELSINGEYLRRTRTNAAGVADFHMPRDLAPGEYLLTAVFPGDTDAYFPSSGEFLLVVEPAELVIETVPSLPGVAFTLDGRRFVADDEGLARIRVATPGDHELVVLADEYRERDHQIEFSRWGTELFGPRITITLPRMQHLQAGFDVFVPAHQVFLDPEGGTVDPSRITAITMRNSLGSVVTYPDGRERMFQASRSVRRPQGLESVEIRYSVESVEVDGSNVVNSGQQRFYAGRDQTWEISLLLYSMRVIPHDALFGFTAGSEIEVTFPNGATELIAAGEDGQLVVPWLARGIYRVQVADAPGWAPAMPVALSRDQEVELRVISYLDMVLAIALGLAVALGLLHRGRPHIIRGTVQAAGRGFGRAGLPVPGLGAGGVEPAGTSAAAPAVAEDPPPESRPQVARRAPARVDVEPLLATIAGRGALDDRVAITVGGRPAALPAPASRELVELAPFLAESATAVTDPSGGGAPPKPNDGRRGAASAGVARRGRKASKKARDGTAATKPRTKAGAKRAAKAAAKPAAEEPAKPVRAGARTSAKAAARPAKREAKPAKAAGKPATAKAGKAAASTAKRDRSSATSATGRERGSGKPKGRRTAAVASARSKTSTKADRAVGATSSKPTGGRAASAAKRRERGAATSSAPPQAASADRARPTLASEQLSMLGIPDIAPTPPPAPEPPPSEMMTMCRHCGLELWAEALYCRRCGEPTARPEQLEPVPVVVAAEPSTGRHRANGSESSGRRRAVGASRKATKRGGS
jgi:hypothetical protein